MVQKLYVPYTEESASDWSPNCVVMYEDYAKLEAELQKYKDQFPDYVECANCGSVTHVEGVR